VKLLGDEINAGKKQRRTLSVCLPPRHPKGWQINDINRSFENATKFKYFGTIVQLGYLEVTVEEKLRSRWPGPFVKVEVCCD
jgi:hypothetical protein